VASGSNRFVTIGAAVGSLVLLAAVVLLLWPGDPPDPTLTASTGPSEGETVGWVSKVEANTIHVNSGPFGGGVIPLLVTKQTRITIGAKEAWFDDIRPGGQVKVSYEVSNGRRLARSVQLLVDEVPRRPVRSEPRVTNTTASGVSPRASATPPPAATSSVSPAPASQAAVGALDARPAPRAEPLQAQAVETPAAARPTTATSARGGTADAGPRPAEATRPALPAPSPAPARAPETPRPAQGEATDGSAAVDWLLSGRK